MIKPLNTYKGNRISTELSWRNIGFSILALAYALTLFSSPMPIEIGFTEILSGLLLVCSTLILLASSVRGDMWRDRQTQVVAVLIFYLVFCPFFLGLHSGYGTKDISRDLIPLLFLVWIPFVTFLSLRQGISIWSRRIVLWAVVVVGVIGAVQFYWGILNIYGSIGDFSANITRGYRQITEGWEQVLRGHSLVESREMALAKREAFLKLYDPGVLFSGIFLFCYGIMALSSKRGKKKAALISFMAGTISAWAFFVIGLRAYAGLFILMVLVFFFSSFYGNRRFMIRAGGIMLLFLAIISPFLKNALALMLSKQLAVGSNGKVQEWAAIWDVVSSKTTTLFWGIGWGGSFQNPILQMEPSRFSHSLLSFYLLKTGLFGLSALILLVVLLISRIDFVRALSCPYRKGILLSGMATFVIGLLFQPTYKMLGFGIVISLVLLWTSTPKHVEGPEQEFYSP